jgi:hypothetical protein
MPLPVREVQGGFDPGEADKIISKSEFLLDLCQSAIARRRMALKSHLMTIELFTHKDVRSHEIDADLSETRMRLNELPERGWGTHEAEVIERKQLALRTIGELEARKTALEGHKRNLASAIKAKSNA